MPFLFSEACILFERLENIESAEPPLLPADRSDRLRSTTEVWFKSHRSVIDKLDACGSTALLSTLLPERRPDRVYNLQNTSLCRVLSRCLNLGASRAKDLQAYRQPGRGDLGACVQRTLEKGGPPALPPVTLREVDDLLSWLGSQCQFSGPAIRAALPNSSEERDVRVGNIFKRLDAKDAKWLVRLILKDFSPVTIDEALVLKSCHFLLPDLMRFQSNLQTAMTLLKTSLNRYPSVTDIRCEELLKMNAASSLRPSVGTKVSRPFFHKARSIEHCLKTLGKRKWLIERKYDGEYCEIHIDSSRSSKPVDCIKIFSKSGKDSTHDRQGIHDYLVKCLRLGEANCKIKHQAILLAELIVWSEADQAPLPFEEIRKHVTRSGRRLGADRDSLPQPHEHLCIVFFDILLLDDDIVMNKSVEERRDVLRNVYVKIPGRVKSAEWKIIDFANAEHSRNMLLLQFAASNAQRCEGLILKPCGVPYFSIDKTPTGHETSFIKLKKDYIAGLGDEADFAIIGASYNPQHALRSGLRNVKWTEFHLGALMNQSEVERFDARPVFRVVGTIQQHACIPKPILEMANTVGAYSAVNHSPTEDPPAFEIQNESRVAISTLFNKPLVFEVLGSGFVKPSNCDFFMLQHARVKKMHQDRSWKDCISFSDLQKMAQAARVLGDESESQETRNELARLERSLKQKFERQRTTTPTPPRRDFLSMALERPQDVNAERSMSEDRVSAMQNGKVKVRKPLGDVAANSLPTPAPTSPAAPESSPNLPSTALATSSPNLKRPRSNMESSMAASNKRQRKENVPSSIAADTADHPSTRSDASKQGNRAQVDQRTASLQKLRDADCPCDIQPMDVMIRDKANAAQQTLCLATTCPFANTVVYPAPCIAKTPYIVTDLLGRHVSTLTPSLSHWMRDCGVYEPGTEIVGESQAYPGMRKVILVEPRRQEAARKILNRLVTMSQQGWKEAVEIWDWRALDALDQHASCHDLRAQYCLGSTRFDENSQLSVFNAENDRY